MAKIGRNDPCPCGSGKKYKKCHGGNMVAPPSVESELQAMYQESQDIEGKSFGQLGASLEELVCDLRAYDRWSSLATVAALSLLAENRTHIVRLNTLLQLVAIHANGDRQITVAALNLWLNQFLRRSRLSHREDPAEDIAVAAVMTPFGGRRVFTGDWSNPDYYLQDVLDALNSGPDTLAPLRANCDAALKISDLLAARKGYERLTGGPDSESSPVWLPPSDEALSLLSLQVFITPSDLEILQISDAVASLSMSFEEFCACAPELTLGTIPRKPFISRGDKLMVAHPTALPMAVISHALSTVRVLGMLPGLERSLHRVQGPRTLHESCLGIEASDFLTPLLPREEFPPLRYVSQTAFRFDRDKYLHVLLLHDDIYEIESAGPTSTWHPPFRDTFGKFIESSSRTLLDQGDCIGGLTLIVIGGVWRSCSMALPSNLGPNCGLQVWSSADANRLMANERRWKLLLWKLSMQRRALEELGISFVAHSDANLYSMWTHHDYRLIPRDAGSDAPTDMSYGPEFIFDMRREHRSGMDDHCIYRPDRGMWERVRKLQTRSHFKEDSARKTYGVLGSVSRGVLEGAVETAKRAWWVDCTTTATDPIRDHLVYDIWETTVNWIERIAPTLDEFVPELGSENLIFKLDVSEIAEQTDWAMERITAIPPASSLAIEVAGRIVSLRLSMAFIAMGYSPKNDAERLLVETLVNGAFEVSGLAGDLNRSAQIHRSLNLSDDDRFMHLFLTRDTRDYLQEFDHQTPELLPQDDLAFGAIRIAQDANLEAPSRIESAQSCNRALKQVVHAYWERIKARLQGIDRTHLVTECITNHERLLIDNDRWRRTSRAVLSLHRDRTDVLQGTQAVTTRRDRTQITHRVIIEMAICECPLAGGRPASQGDIDFLGSQVLLLIATAAHSDAIRAGCTEAFLDISALGELIFGDDFMDVMRPYMSGHFEKQHMANVEAYREMFGSTEATQTEVQLFGREFVESFLGEFGISPARLKDLGILLMEDAIKQKAVVVRRESASLSETLLSQGFSQAEIEGIWHSFALRPRARWDSTQEPFRDKDWYPWRYRRRLSYMTRPFVDIGDGRVVYAPGFCEDSFRHTLMECFQGAFETKYFDSGRMRKWIGAVNARRGLDFNKAVAELFGREGWNFRIEIGMTELGADPIEASGDVDVLAWKSDVVCVCECKELLFARTISEVAAQLTNFQGKPGDDLNKHLRRVKFIQSHNDSLFRITNIATPRIIAMLVTSKIVPMQFVKGLPTQTVSVDQLTGTYLRNLLR